MENAIPATWGFSQLERGQSRAHRDAPEHARYNAIQLEARTRPIVAYSRRARDQRLPRALHHMVKTDRPEMIREQDYFDPWIRSSKLTRC